MTDSELNEYIYNYLTKDKTKSAILLTAPWGTGKSYYIQNVLKPFLETKDPSHKCIIVSLYDISTTAELSKSIYFEKRFHSISKTKTHKKVHAMAKPIIAGLFGIGKTVLKSMTSVDLDFSASSPNWTELLESVNFIGDLIVLEDLERTKINMKEILGYVNNLVELDGVKVLLVANEDEIIKGSVTTQKDEFDKDKTVIEYCPAEETYLRTKEKTISDTIHYVGNTYKALENILRSFNNHWFNYFLLQKNEFSDIQVVSNIINIMNTVKSENLRSIIFGCQKTIDMFQYVDESFDINFLQYLLCSNIAFALRLKKDDSIVWDDQDLVYSVSLGTYPFPLTKNAYNYIKHQAKIDPSELKIYNYTYCQQRAFKKAQNELEPYFKTIYNYFKCPENEVVTAVNYIANKLETTTDIPLSEYGTLANHLVAIHQVIGNTNTINRCKAAMLYTLSKNKDKNIEDRISFHGGIQLESQEAQQEFSDWKSEMLEALNSSSKNELHFDYDNNELYTFNEYVHSHQNDYYNQRKFAALFDVDSLLLMLKKATPEQIWNLRGAFNSIYYISNIGEFFAEDRPALLKIKNGVDLLINCGEITDKIVLLELNYFSNNLQSYIDKLQ